MTTDGLDRDDLDDNDVDNDLERDGLDTDDLRRLVEALDVAIVLRELDPPRFTYVSPGFERLFGWPAQAVLDDPWFLKVHAHPEDRDEATARMADYSAHLRGEPLPDIEWRIVRADGEVRWVRARRQVLEAEGDRPTRLVGFVEDVTDKKQVELEAAQPEWFDAITATVPIGFAIRDIATEEYQYVSPAYEEIFGIPATDFYADKRAPYKLLAPESQPLGVEGLAAAAAGRRWRYDARIIRPDGESRWIRGHQLPTTDDADGVGRWLANTVEDVTAQRIADEQLRVLVDANLVGVMVADGHRILDANDRYLQILGYTRDDLEAGLPWSQMTPPEWADATADAMRQLEECGRYDPYEKEFSTKSGGRVSVMIGGAVLSADPLTYTAMVLDLTDVKHVEVALRQAEAEAQRANQAKSAFLSRMSHELRTPLNAVIGFGQLLAMDDLRPDQDEAVAQIVKGGKHLLSLINEVLDISRIESGTLALSLEPVHLAEVVAEALALVRHLGDLRGVTISDRCPPSCSTFVQADRQRLRQVVLNLLANAIKYNRDHGSVTVRCRPAADGRSVRLEVADTGIGIPEAAMARLFSPFDRLGAEHTDVEGTGLGLALTHRLVEAMGGTIGAESVAGQGSTFWVELEVAQNVEAVDVLQAAEPAATTADAPPEVTVLYVEDNQANVRLVQRILALREGVGVIVAMQASLGLDLAKAHRPDLILLDLNLPDMPGREALRRLRADPDTADVPVVVVSADATPGQITRLKDEGAAAYLAKPFDIEQLLALVDDLALRS